MPFPSVKLRTSFTTSQFAEPVWSVLSGVTSFRATTGRKSELDALSPGKFLAKVDNVDRALDPGNTAGAYYGYLEPGKQTRFTAKYDPTGGTTVITYVGVGAATHGNNTSLTPALPASWAAGDVAFIVAAIRNSGTGTVDEPDGWKAIATSGNVSVLARVLVAGDVAPTVTFTGGVANATTSAVCGAWRGVEMDLDDLVVSFADQLNASAQNIAVPGLTMTEAGLLCMVVGWKQDDGTSIATLSGQLLTEIVDAPTATGSDQYLEWQYRIQTTAANFTATTLTVTGGASAISRAIVIAVRPYRGTPYQLFNGHGDGFPQEWSHRMGTTTVEASGPFQFLDREPVPDPLTAVILTSDPRVWYRLNEKAGTVLVDSTIRGTHGYWIPDMRNVKTATGLHRGSDSAIQLPAAPARGDGSIPLRSILPWVNPVSLEFWLKIDKPPKSLSDPLLLGAEDWSSTMAGGGLNFRIWGQELDYPGAMDFIVVDNPNLSLANIAVATTAYDFSYFNVCDGQPHHIVATIDSSGTFLCIWVDGVDRAPYNNITGSLAANPPPYESLYLNVFPGWDGTTVLDEVAIYDRELLEEEINEHHQAGAFPGNGQTTGERLDYMLDLMEWPADRRYIQDGQTVLGVADDLGGANGLTYAAALSRTEQGLVYEAHSLGGWIGFQDRSGRQTDTRSSTVQSFFSDSTLHIAFASAIAYSDITLSANDWPVANVVTVGWVGGEVEARDQTSVDVHGPILAKVDTLLERLDEAQNLAEFILQESAGRFTRITSITIRPAAYTATLSDTTLADRAWQACLGRVEGDRVRVAHKPGGSGIQLDQELLIIGREHEASSGTSDWRTTFYFSAASTIDYWILGTGALGTTTVLSY